MSTMESTIEGFNFFKHILSPSIIVGFLIFMFSNFNPTVLFGIFSALAILVSMAMSFRFLPILLNLNSK